ncbi:plasmid stability/partitioning protein [Salmonella enterica]|nr:plasmid stability/partitioning protein [Salmonella enterica]EHV2061066.1 plasmid stability/partitioning protein [Salmonella enterica]
MDINKLKKHAPIIEPSESKTVNDFIAQGDKKPTKKAESIMVGFRMDEDTLERLNRLTNGLGKKRINILRASLLAFESLSPSDKAKFLIEIMR